MQKLIISKKGLEKLEKELDYLQNTKRKQVATRLKSAIEQGDLSENAEYQDAKDQQAWTEGRIIELKNKIKNVQIIKKEKNGKITVGSQVKIKNNGQEFEYTIVGSQEADPLQGKISNESPLGQAFIGHRKGEKVNVQTPEGQIQYNILEIK